MSPSRGEADTQSSEDSDMPPGPRTTLRGCASSSARSLLLVMAKSPVRKDRQTLIAEALNDLFAKYNVPIVRD